MSAASAWLQAARPLAQVNIAVPVALGTMLAWARHGVLDVGMLILAFALGLVDQLFIVFANDVADEPGDRRNATFNRFSGGSRVLVDGKLERSALARAAMAMAVVMLLVCAWAAIMLDRPLLLAFWVAAVGLLWAYSFSPLRLAYRGLGEAAQGLGVGVVLPMMGWYVQLGHFEAFPWMALLPAFVLGVASNITTALPDAPADAAADKRTWPVRYGPRRARKHSLQLIAIGTLLTPAVLPGLSHAGLAAIELLPALALVFNLRGLRSAEAQDHAACSRFVVLNGVAINLTLLGWAIALAVHPAALG